MELIQVQGKDDVPPFDREILNERLHVAALGDVWSANAECQEYLALGMSKGSVLLLGCKEEQTQFERLLKEKGWDIWGLQGVFFGLIHEQKSMLSF